MKHTPKNGSLFMREVDSKLFVCFEPCDNKEPSSSFILIDEYCKEHYKVQWDKENIFTTREPYVHTTSFRLISI